MYLVETCEMKNLRFEQVLGETEVIPSHSTHSKVSPHEFPQELNYVFSFDIGDFICLIFKKGGGGVNAMKSSGIGPVS